MAATKLSHALARFVFASLTVLGVLITILVATRVISAMQRQQDQLISHEIHTISSSFRLFLTQRMLLLEEQAQQSLVVQTVMQPEINAGIINDYMQNHVMLGQSYIQRIVDFEGVDIYADQKLNTLSAKQRDWLTSILNGEMTHYVGVEYLLSNKYWILATPVIYNGQVEGSVLTYIPLADINHHLVLGKSGRFNVELIHKEQRLILFGQELVGDSRDIMWPEEKVTLRFTMDRSVIDAEVNSLVLELSVLILTIMLIATMLAYYYGVNRFVEPLQRLANATSDISKDEYISLRENVSIVEISNLMRSFNLMARQIKQRELALNTSIDQTKAINDKLKFTQAQVVQSEKMASLGLLSAGIAHEINNPMAFVKSNIDTLEQYREQINAFITELTKLDTVNQQDIEQLKKTHDIDYIVEDLLPLLVSSQDGVSRVVDIVNGLKLFARVDALTPELVDINAGIEATLTIVQNEIKYKSEIKLALEKLPDVYAFAGQINQVVLNLLVNANQSIQEQGTVNLRTYADDRWVYIEVEDDGCGIEPAVVEKIFEPFYSTKQTTGGTGLGLAISHGIVKQHDGLITVKSTVGQGSCFTVCLPIPQKST